MRQTLVTVAVGAGLATAAGPVSAQIFEVIHPDVDRGGFELEALNGLILDDVAEGEERSAHEFALGYGVFDFWKSTLAIELANPESAPVEFEAVEWENTFILPIGSGHDHAHRHDAADFSHADWVVGFHTVWEIPNEGGIDDGAVAFGPIAEVIWGPLTVLPNLFVEVPFSDDTDPGLGYSLQLKTPVATDFDIGLEAFGDIEEAFGDAPPLGQTEHLIGPALYGAFLVGDNNLLEPRVAALFGLTDRSPNAVISLNLELKF